MSLFTADKKCLFSKLSKENGISFRSMESYSNEMIVEKLRSKKYNDY